MTVERRGRIPPSHTELRGPVRYARPLDIRDYSGTVADRIPASEKEPGAHSFMSWAPYEPRVLREYALIADGERGALVGPCGELAWMCCPRWDSDAVFSTLLGGNGTYAITPHGDRYVWGGYYERGSLIWRNRWVTNSGIIECREALSFPGDRQRAVVLRRVHAVQGTAHLRVRLDLRTGFGAHHSASLRRADGCWTGKLGDLRVRWHGASAAAPLPGAEDGPLETVLEVAAGAHHDLVLELSAAELPATPPDPGLAWESTADAWRRALPAVEGTIADEDTLHACAVLRGLTSHTGGIVAAATTGLPERARAGGNYDYRYVWIRDQCFAGQGLAAIGAGEFLDTATSFVTERLLSDGPELRPAYTVTGQDLPAERSLPLPGYPGGAAKVGNRASRQHQLDTFGETLMLLAAAARHDRLTADGERAAKVAVRAVAEGWQEPEAGVWELEPSWWAHSRLICVAGLRAAARDIAGSEEAAAWTGLADTLLAETGRRCTGPGGRWQRTPTDSRVDAALLLPAIRGALAPGDPRHQATMRAVESDLTRGGYVHRFRHDERRLGSAEGAFLLCGFMMALAAHQQGDTVAANRWFERSRGVYGPPGLYAEEYDVTQRQLRGNLPQMFVHALLLEAATRLASPSPPSP